MTDTTWPTTASEIRERILKTYHDLMDKRLARVPRGRIQWRIQPKWGCGSPATFSQPGTVLQAALDDVICWGHAREGAYGEDQLIEAQKDDALALVAICVVSERCHWLWIDLLTGEERKVPKIGERRCKHTRITVERFDALLREAQDRIDLTKLKVGEIAPEITRLINGRAELLGKGGTTRETQLIK